MSDAKGRLVVTPEDDANRPLAVLARAADRFVANPGPNEMAVVISRTGNGGGHVDVSACATIDVAFAHALLTTILNERLRQEMGFNRPPLVSLPEDASLPAGLRR